MAKIAILVPHQEMCEIARPLIEQYSNLNVICLEYIQTAQVKHRAHELEEQGCELIVARGVHARIIKRSIKVPLVEMRVTAQELGMIMLDIKRELGQSQPRIGLVGFDNMLCDTKPFNMLFDIDLRTYLVDRDSELVPAVELALQEGCQAVVGGDIVCACAQDMGLPNRFIPSGAESLRAALEIASRVSYAIDLEKHDRALMDTMLNYTFTGIMRVDKNGFILRINRAGYNMLGLTPSEVVGSRVTDVLPELAEKTLKDTLEKGEEVYASLMGFQKRSLVVNLAPLRIDGENSGAILTFQEGRRIIEMDSQLRQELYQRGYIARYSFGATKLKSKESQALERMAKRIAKYDAPVLIKGETGTGKGIMAQCIHNESLQRHSAYVWADCSAWQPETLDTMLFGNYTTRKDSPACMVELAQEGTLYLSHIETLSSETQYKLHNLIQGRFLHNGSNRSVAAKVRIITSTSVSLAAQVENGAFRNDLYYSLCPLSLELRPLRERREDILSWAAFYLKEWGTKYDRYVHMTQDAQKFMLEYDWPGNLDQLNNVCQRIVLLTERRNIDRAFLRRQLDQVTPKILPGTKEVVVCKDPKAVELADLLRRHNGNRANAAAELGVSKTTLWRHIKKYGIEKDFTF